VPSQRTQSSKQTFPQGTISADTNVQSLNRKISAALWSTGRLGNRDKSIFLIRVADRKATYSTFRSMFLTRVNGERK